MNQRVTNVNIGGISKEKLVTAYRESVIKVAYYLLDGEKTTKELRELSGIKNSTSLLQKNYYNWFLRVNRGIYKLTDLGAEELKDYTNLFSDLNLHFQFEDLSLIDSKLSILFVSGFINSLQY